VRCYKNENSSSIHKKFDLKGAKIGKKFYFKSLMKKAEENQEHQTDFKLVLKSGKAVIFSQFEQEQKAEFKKSFLEESQQVIVQ